MKFEPLSIGDVTFMINRTIEQAPTATLIREFFKNAEENASLAEEGNRHIKIYPVEIDDVRKLAFWNTGVGMGYEELRKITDLSSSIGKEMALDGNFGIGAKVSGLTVSKAGIRYRSCKDGCVHQVIIGYDSDVGTYGRFAVELPDGTTDTVYDVTDIAKSEGMDTDYDWTEVVLFGQSDDHDTVAEPLGKGVKKDRSYIPTAIFQRFATIADGIDLKIDTAMTKGGGKEETGRFRGLKTLNDVISEIKLRHETVKDEDTGIAIHYVYDPKHEHSSHSLSARANPATASTAFCAIVHKGERYDFKNQKGWSAAAPNFGIPFGSKVLTVEIMIPDDMALPSQYRDGLTWPENREAMIADDFSPWVRDLMPEWVKEIIKDESPEANDNLEDIQADLQKLLDEFRVPTVTRTFTNKKESEDSDEDEEGMDSTEPTSILEEEFKHELSSEPREEGDIRGMKRAKNKKVRKAPEGARASMASKALERAPEINILVKEEEIADKEIKGRAGRYYKDVQAIFVNGLYSAADRMAVELERELKGEGEPEQVREAVLKASRKYMAFRVGKAVCYAISKRLVDDWTTEDLDKATSPESLSMAADDYKQDISSAKRWARELLKLEQMKEAA